ncbi:MAG: hypothetical protein AAF825_04735 [Pseudomonadota bacterium]
MMRIYLPITFGALCLTSDASAQATDPAPWLAMAEVCEEVVWSNSEAPLAGFAPAAPIVDTMGLEEIAVRHPTALVAAGAVTPGDWFLCVVTGEPPLAAADADAVIAALIAWQRDRLRLAGHVEVNLGSNEIGPVRVRCRRDGAAVLVAVLDVEGDVRLGVTTGLPQSVENPCLTPSS